MKKVEKNYSYTYSNIQNIIFYKFISILAAFSILLFLTSCMEKIVRPDPPNIKDTEIFEAHFGEVWSALEATIRERRYQVDVIDRERGVLNTQTITLDEGVRGDVEIADIAVRPSVTLGIWKQIRYSYSIHVVETRYSITRVQIKIKMEAYESNVTNEWHTCYSRGILEEQIFISIRKKL